ncbi:MAG: Coq4 family protein [Actinomycetota bacterium]
MTMTPETDQYEPVVDREFAEIFLRNVDDPIKTHVMGMFHGWWEVAPESAIEQYLELFRAQPGAIEYLAERHLPEPLSLDDLADHGPGTLGHAYRSFIVDNDLMANLATNYRELHERLGSAGQLDRMPDDLRYAVVRGFMLHDFVHTITGNPPNARGELTVAGFHFAQMQYPYHAFRLAVTTGHVALVNPKGIVMVMDAFCEGWMRGRQASNIHFTKWEEELDRPLADIRAEYGVEVTA